jgi:hypothetical protein
MAEPKHFYLDESMLAQRLVEVISAAGHVVHKCGSEVPRGLADTAWMNALADRDWIVLLRDQRIRFNRLERDSLASSKIGAFVFTGGQVTGEETAKTIGGCLGKIVMLDDATSRPYVFTITRAGNISQAL